MTNQSIERINQTTRRIKGENIDFTLEKVDGDIKAYGKYGSANNTLILHITAKDAILFGMNLKEMGEWE